MSIESQKLLPCRQEQRIHIIVFHPNAYSHLNTGTALGLPDRSPRSHSQTQVPVPWSQVPDPRPSTRSQSPVPGPSPRSQVQAPGFHVPTSRFQVPGVPGPSPSPRSQSQVPVPDPDPSTRSQVPGPSPRSQSQ